MKKSYIIAFAVVLVLVAGAVLFARQNNENGNTAQRDTAPSRAMNDMASSEESSIKSEQGNAPTTNEPMATGKPGAYTTYSDAAAKSATGTKLLFFHASWCPQCRALEADITSNTIPDNTTIFKVDYDSNQALRQKYGVTIQTTVVRIDDKGNLVKKYIAYNEPTLANVIKNVQ